MNHSLSDKIFNVFNSTFILFMVAIVAYPLIYIISASISDPLSVNSGGMWLYPIDITFEGYLRVFDNTEIWMGYRNTVVYTVLGTLFHLAILLPCAYALSHRDMWGKSGILIFILLTMFFNGGLIPNYLLVMDLGMINTLWAVIIPNAIGVWAIIVTRTFFQMNVPRELQEAAEIDGSHQFGVFFRIALPLSGPIIAVMALFHAVGLWNQYFAAMMYLSKRELFPLQLILREILILQEMNSSMVMDGDQLESLAEQARIADIMKYAVMIVSVLPLLIVYPFLQRFFVKGVLVGSLKE